MLAAAIPPPIEILLAWAVLLPALCGLGFGSARLLPGPKERVDPSVAFWLGTATAAALVAAWHLWLRIDGRVWIMLGPLAAAGLAAELRERRAALTSLRPRHAVAGLCLAAFALWVATRAVPAGFNPDDGLYYTQTVRWNSLYPAVHGLGNLHPFLAFNNAYHLLVAAMGVGPFHLRGEHLANGLFLLAATGACAADGVGILDLREPLRAADVFAAFLLGSALDFSVDPNLSTPSADFAVHMLGTGLLLAAVSPILRGERIGSRRMIAIAATCAGAVEFKQSLVCIALPMAAAALWQWRQSGPPERGPATLLSCAGICAGLAAPWIAHGVILSGLPLYPLPWPDLGVSWAMDTTVVRSMYEWVQAYARWPGHPLQEIAGSTRWAGVWFAREWMNNRTFLLPSALGTVGALAAAAAFLAGRRPSRPAAAALVPVWAGIALWWLMAPDTRFAGPLLWAGGALLALAGAQAWQPALTGVTRVLLTALAVAAAAGSFAAWSPRFSWVDDFPPLRHDVGNPRGRLASGESVDLDGGDGCWDPPCGRPPLDSRLRLREPGDWSAGFTLAPAQTRSRSGE